MSKMRIVLLPLSFIYGIAVGIRNFLFRIGVLESHRFDVPVICVGNITVGGTGKTPHTEIIIAELRKKFRVACLSRGYKRKTSGFILASSDSTANDIGDELFQIWSKFPDILVACDANRVRGIKKLLALPEPPEVIVLDDAFQHRYVKADKNILLIDFNRPVHEDSLLPAGNLRERVGALKRADYIIVTKCPEDFRPIERRILYKRLEVMPYQKLFFTRTGYGKLLPFSAKNPPVRLTSQCSLLCLTGIAQPGPYIQYLKSFTSQVKVLQYADHYDYTAKDVEHIQQVFDSMKGEKYILTTEKDMARLRSGIWPKELKRFTYYIPITPVFVENKDLFFNEISEYVRKNKK